MTSMEIAALIEQSGEADSANAAKKPSRRVLVVVVLVALLCVVVAVVIFLTVATPSTPSPASHVVPRTQQPVQPSNADGSVPPSKGGTPVPSGSYFTVKNPFLPLITQGQTSGLPATNG